MSPLVLDEHRKLFRDEASFREFVRILSQQLGKDLSPVISNEEVLGAMLSPEATKEMLSERMMRRIATSPEILDEIMDRMEIDEIVD